jgi:hypothetical protein
MAPVIEARRKAVRRFVFRLSVKNRNDSPLFHVRTSAPPCRNRAACCLCEFCVNRVTLGDVGHYQ